jgi:Kef-type K+ transport system membrane component KefB
MLILLFTLSMESVRFALGSGQAGHGLLSGLAWEIFGSFAFGGIVGACFAFYLRHVGREVTVVLLGVAVVLSQVGGALHFEPLLAALGAGLVVENIAPPEGDALRLAVERGALPVLVLFFAAAGANLHLGALATVGLLAVAIAAVRMGLIRGSAAVGARVAGLEGQPPALAWMGLVSQAGVTLGLAILINAEFPDWGGRLYALIVSMITLHETIGPILFRSALAKAGEVGKMDVMPHAS